MPDELDNEKYVERMENIEAKVSEIENRILTEELNLRELRKEVRDIDEAGDVPTESIRKKLIGLEKRLEEDLEEVEKWKDNFDDVISKVDSFEEDKKKLSKRIKKLKKTVSKLKDKKEKSLDKEDKKRLKRVDELEKKVDNIRSDIEDILLGDTDINIEAELEKSEAWNDIKEKVNELREAPIEAGETEELLTEFDELKKRFNELENKMPDLLEEIKQIKMNLPIEDIEDVYSKINRLEEGQEALSIKIDAKYDSILSSDEFVDIKNRLDSVEEDNSLLFSNVNLDSLGKVIENFSEIKEKVDALEGELNNMDDDFSGGVTNIESKIEEMLEAKLEVDRSDESKSISDKSERTDTVSDSVDDIVNESGEEMKRDIASILRKLVDESNERKAEVDWLKREIEQLRAHIREKERRTPIVLE